MHSLAVLIYSKCKLQTSEVSVQSVCLMLYCLMYSVVYCILHQAVHVAKIKYLTMSLYILLFAKIPT